MLREKSGVFNRTNPVSLAIHEKGGGWNAKEPRISISRERRTNKIACNVARYFEAGWRDEHTWPYLTFRNYRNR